MATRATEAANTIDATVSRLPDRSRDRLVVVGAVLVTVVLWASAFVVIRFAGRQFSPGPLALARLVVGSLALGGVMVVRGERLPAGRSLGLALLCGLLWFGVYNVALNAAERRIDAGTTSLLVNTGPIFIALLAGVVLREGFPPALLRGCVVAFAGAALIGVAVSRHGLHNVWGAVLCVVAALAYAGGVVAQKPALRGASGVAAVPLAIASLLLIVLIAPERRRQRLRPGLGCRRSPAPRGTAGRCCGSEKIHRQVKTRSKTAACTAASARPASRSTARPCTTAQARTAAATAAKAAAGAAGAAIWAFGISLPTTNVVDSGSAIPNSARATAAQAMAVTSERPPIKASASRSPQHRSPRPAAAA